jgi:NAD(P)-dependent dehydrogenase (short-subunit alcohol dehydrogenase family)
MLGQAGATVYVTGRSTKGHRSPMNRPETIEETAELVTRAGGFGIPVQVDHTVGDEVRALFERVEHEHGGQLDVLVNDVWGGDPLTEWQVPAWEQTPERGFLLLIQAVNSHILAIRYGVPLMVHRNSGLVVEVTDGVGYAYRAPGLFYSLAKISAIHIAESLAVDFKRRDLEITSVALTPGFIRSEAILERFGVMEQNWRDALIGDPESDFKWSESPCYMGKAIVSLMQDPLLNHKSGATLSTWEMAKEYGFLDVDGTQPNWGEFVASRGL